MSKNTKRLKRAIEQIDEAQPLCPSPGCDSLADAAMSIDLVVSELEAATQELPILCPTEGNHNWRCECKKCGMKLYINMDLPEPMNDGTLEHDPHKPEPPEFTKRLRIWADKYNKGRETSIEQLALEGCGYLQMACDRLESQAEQLKRYKRMVNIPDLLEDGFMAVGQELIKRDEQLAAKDKEIIRLNELVFAYESVQAPVNPLIVKLAAKDKEIERLKAELLYIQQKSVTLFEAKDRAKQVLSKP